METSNTQMKITTMISTFKIAFPYYFKDLSNEEILGMYSIYEQELGKYNDETIKSATSSIIRSNKFMPSLSEIIEQCEKNKVTKRNEIIEKMKSDGYFKDIREIEKVYLWLEQGIIPSWLKEDMKKYSIKSLPNSQALIGG